MGRALGYFHWSKRFCHKKKTKGEPAFRKRIHLVWNIPKAIPAMLGTSIPPSCQKSALQSLWPDFQSTCCLFVLLTSTGIECSAHPEVILGLVTCLFGHVPGEWQPPVWNPNLQETGMEVLPFFSSVIILIRQALKLRTMTLWVPSSFFGGGGRELLKFGKKKKGKVFIKISLAVF